MNHPTSDSTAPLSRRLAAWLSNDVVGGLLILGAALLGIVLANTPAAGAYFGLRDFRFGPDALHLNLSVGAWTADGLLAIFFFIVGLELKQEFITGRLRNLRAAALPIVAAAGGVVIPASIYTLVNLGQGSEALHGWAIPAATDIAFALAVFAIVGRHLPPALRIFLLTLAVVDDLIAIGIIALFYSDGLSLPMLLLAGLVIALFGFTIRQAWASVWILLPLALAAWVLVHASGVHATIAGVALGLVVPAVAGRPGEQSPSPAVRLGHQLHPLSVGFAVPLFAFFAAGVRVEGAGALLSAFGDPVTLGIVFGLLLGKPIGIVGASYLMTRLPGIRLPANVSWADLTGMALVAGIGFTVSLLVAELAFGLGTLHDDHAKVGILAGSLVAAIVGAMVLAARNRLHAQRPEAADPS